MKNNPGQFAALFPTEEKAYGASIGCGLVDGFIVSIEFFWDLIKGVTQAGTGFVKSTYNFFKKAFKYSAYLTTGQTLLVVADAYKASTEAWSKIKDIASFIKNAVASYNGEEFKEFLNSVYLSVEEWFGSFLSYTTEAGYKVGRLAFDIVSTFFTVGASTAGKAAKLLNEVMVLFSKWDLKGIAKNLNNILSAADDAGDQNKFIESLIDKCKILGKGCFVRDTPVLMAAKANGYKLRKYSKTFAVAASMPIVAVPIQEVQLLDYVVAHNTINAGYGLTASTDKNIHLEFKYKDPYTSEQQLEKDNYEINDTDWNEVVFEDNRLFTTKSSNMNSLENGEAETSGSLSNLGYSSCKLALHSDWILKKGYYVGAVVELNLPEQGISGSFRITSIKHIIPQKKPVNDVDSDDYSYRPVTALFTHKSSEVYEIKFKNGDKLGVTYRHPIYSTTVGSWKLAGELEIGEKVLIYNGETTVISSEIKEGSETVYNLEVKELHNFLVGESGIVVHNNYLSFAKKFVDYIITFDNSVNNPDGLQKVWRL